ncbi:hypothetical protein VI817_009963 [Penicillium citrinum]|nr:hypothetical protein VI817_009963 [Penicillium citrinum]
MDTLLEQLETKHQRVFRPSTHTVEATEVNEATPWLRRTRWTQYLAGRLSETLLSLIQIPDPDPEDPVSQICQALNHMACTSQQIAKQCGYLICTEIVQTETDILSKTPLQAYMDLESIIKYIHPWQQIVCFFACTQQTSNADCLYYCFNRRQHHTWNILWRFALSAASAISVAESPDPLEKEDLICALAVLGRSRTGWQSSDSYSSLLSKIIKIARFFVLGCALWLDLYTEQIIQDFSGRYLSNDQDLAMNYNTTEPEHIGWIGQDRRSLWLDPRPHNYSRDPSFIRTSSVGSYHICLLDSVEYPSGQSSRELFWIELSSRFSDSLACTERSVTGKLYSTGALTSAVVPGSLLYRCYLDYVCRFREKLGVLIYLCAGQSGRASEFLSIRHRNTENVYWNIFIEDSLMVLAVQYHKGFYISNNIKIIHQYLSRAIGSLLIQYLWLILPLVERFETLYYSDNRLLSISQTVFFWGPDPLNQRRNIAIAISRRFLCTDSSLNQETNQKDYSDDLSDNNSEASYLDLQAGHSAYIAGIVYRRQMHEALGTLAFRCTIFRKISQD